VEEYHEDRIKEKRLHKKRKRDHDKQELIELECLRSSNEARAFCRKLNRSRKTFNPEQLYVEIKMVQF
jgi:hypothetical protein